jgi:hypothetical protein
MLGEMMVEKARYGEKVSTTITDEPLPVFKPEFGIRVCFKSGCQVTFTGTYEKRSQVVIIEGARATAVINFSSVDFLELSPVRG